MTGLPSGGESGVTNTDEFMIKGVVDSRKIINIRDPLPMDGNARGLLEYLIDPSNVKKTGFSKFKPK